MAKLPRMLVSTMIVIFVYITINKLFPEKKKLSDINSEKDLRGGDLVKNSLIKNLINHEIVKKILNDRVLKAGLITAYFLYISYNFHDEIETLLGDTVFKRISGKKVDGTLKIVCDIINRHELNLHPKAMKILIINNDLSYEDKINLLKIKLDFIINGECAGKKRFLIVYIIATFAAVWISGPVGLGMFLDALYRLFKEGRISRALYDQIVEIVRDSWNKVPVEHLL
jgi:hypothetical protein